jgi:hypothetical protein
LKTHSDDALVASIHEAVLRAAVDRLTAVAPDRSTGSVDDADGKYS